MNPTDLPLHLLLRQARITAKLSQTELAAKVGCQQSQISMMEAGRSTALSKEAIEKAAGLLGVTLPAQAPMAAPLTGACFCPNFLCPTNYPYLLGEQVFFLPLGLAGCGEHCLLCGELLARTCPSCGVPVHAHAACCPSCGGTLLSMPSGYVADLASWVKTQQLAQTTLAGLLTRPS